MNIKILFFFTEHILILFEIKTLFVPCINHTLNQCGVHSFATVPLCVTVFFWGVGGTLQSLLKVLNLMMQYQNL